MLVPFCFIGNKRNVLLLRELIKAGCVFRLVAEV